MLISCFSCSESVSLHTNTKCRTFIAKRKHMKQMEFAARWWIIIEVWRTQKCTLQISNIISFENDNKLWNLCKNCFDLIPIYLTISSINFFKKQYFVYLVFSCVSHWIMMTTWLKMNTCKISEFWTKLNRIGNVLPFHQEANKFSIASIIR